MTSPDPIDSLSFANAVGGTYSTFLWLDVSDRGIVLPDDLTAPGTPIALPYTNIFIYAENVTITSKVSWPGKNICIACNSLTLQGDTAVIDVSGPAGLGVAPVVTGTGSNGNAGGNGGSIWLYVEELTPDIVQGLSLLANGGAGGEGGGTSGPGQTGGAGGTGGNAGTISYLWGSPAGSALVLLLECSSLSWTAVLGQTPAIVSKAGSLLTSTQLSSLQSTLSLYSSYVSAATACLGSVNTLLNTTPPTGQTALPSDLSQALLAFANGLKSLLSATEGPDLPDDTLVQATSNVNLAAQAYLKAWKQTPPAPVDATTLMQNLNLATTSWVGATSSALRTALYNTTTPISSQVYTQQNAVAGQCQIIPGPGGVGGAAPVLNGKGGTMGSSGSAGTLNYQELAFNGQATDLDVLMPYAFPDQCQMLLNKANALFFQNSLQSVQDASTIYARLLKRLAFQPTIEASIASPTTPGAPLSALQTLYTEFESTYNLTVSSIDQLQSIYSQAKSFNNQISVGADLFGHSPDWAPRLTYTYYAQEASDFISALEPVETAYQNARATQASLTDVSSGQVAAAAGVQKAQAQIGLLTNESGPLATSASTISMYSPLVTAKMQQVKADLQAVAADIQASINLDPAALLDAFATVAMAPSVPFALAEGGKAAYDAFTTVKDSSGASVNKDYVITELGQAGNQLSTLSESFSTRRDQTLEPDDPGGLKLLASLNDVEDLYNQFKAAIPSNDGSALEDSITDLKNVLTTRNNAVVSYNSALELLRQAQLDEDYYTKQALAYGAKAAAQMDPALPSILLWLRRTQDNYQLQAMRLLNYANKAIYYWGLVQPADFASPGPLQSSETLNNDKLLLGTSFENAISNFAGSSPSHWPVGSKQGVLYKLSMPQLFTLQTPLTSPLSGGTYYRVQISLAPSADVNGAGNLPFFSGRANIRLDRMRLWLIGAKVSPDPNTGSKPINVVITQLGTETIQDGKRQSFDFQHDPVTMNFQFESKGISTISDCTQNQVLNEQLGMSYYVGQGQPSDTSIAAIGPWSTWQFELRASENSNLSMKNLTAAYIEFGGYSSSFTTSAFLEPRNIREIKQKGSSALTPPLNNVRTPPNLPNGIGSQIHGGKPRTQKQPNKAVPFPVPTWLEKHHPLIRPKIAAPAYHPKQSLSGSTIAKIRQKPLEHLHSTINGQKPVIHAAPVIVNGSSPLKINGNQTVINGVKAPAVRAASNEATATIKAPAPLSRSSFRQFQQDLKASTITADSTSPFFGLPTELDATVGTYLSLPSDEPALGMNYYYVVDPQYFRLASPISDSIFVPLIAGTTQITVNGSAPGTVWFTPLGTIDVNINNAPGPNRPSISLASKPTLAQTRSVVKASTNSSNVVPTYQALTEYVGVSFSLPNAAGAIHYTCDPTYLQQTIAEEAAIFMPLKGGSTAIRALIPPSGTSLTWQEFSYTVDIIPNTSQTSTLFPSTDKTFQTLPAKKGAVATESVRTARASHTRNEASILVNANSKQNKSSTYRPNAHTNVSKVATPAMGGEFPTNPRHATHARSKSKTHSIGIAAAVIPPSGSTQTLYEQVNVPFLLHAPIIGDFVGFSHWDFDTTFLTMASSQVQQPGITGPAVQFTPLKAGQTQLVLTWSTGSSGTISALTWNVFIST